MNNYYSTPDSNNEELILKIKDLKKKRNAVILAHNYQLPEVQDIADFVGDSLGLSMEASKTDCKVIVFCGVYFMAETAKILSPEKTVLMPDPDAGCPMASMIAVDDLLKMQAEHPDAKTICYVNSFAEIKAHCDYCCTSANALKMVESLPYDEFIFVPDRYLGSFVKGKTGKKIHLWKGFCPVHLKFIKENIAEARSKYPNAKVMVHPECSEEIVAAADYALGTEGMLRHARSAAGENEYIIGTEESFIYRLAKEVPGKKFYPLSKSCVCPNMKKTTLEKVLWCLEDMKTEITVDPLIAQKAKLSIDRMLEVK
ncbi:MAG: quinolinate synthase [Candidatus Wallbacteria bacterium GWC2_49_35]|uniref:Quinolinate synthase n=1 Tax=Candidatus Wallbacteria bacterium GWC2_49_35 TaxID=1817813 RepID=A0A1F7WG44_9BACT|nr:MAG: quinolinate synthase [Candidatus Wallbacteria bacterium GWC2_49_35]HBC75011.1 quinolinate synthase [Candidatus Wallbacteria bacterium]